MRSSSLRCALHRTTGLLIFNVSHSVKEEEKRWEDKKAEAESKGFARRDTVEDKVFMGQTFQAPENISSGVSVANLPAQERQPTAFDSYQLSTTDFTSRVTPHGSRRSTGALGAGFGAKEDKRLSFLRPRQSLQPHTGSSSIAPKYDENGQPIDETLTPEQQMLKRKEYMKSFEGTSMSASEHFLLADLDFQKDAMLFGTTRDEFERNVTKLKNVIIAYNKWERTDNFYRYTTIILKLLTLWIVLESLQQFYELRLFASHYDDFVEAMEMDLVALERNRAADFADAARDLKDHKPDFRPVLAAIAAERDRVVEVETRTEESPTSTAGIVDLAWDAIGANMGRGRAEARPAPPAAPISAVELMSGKGAHPMDTTFEEQHQSRQRRAEEVREMRRLASGSGAPRRDSVWKHVGSSVKNRLLGGQPLVHEDLTRFSYAASPTSIPTMRALRRILLPRSEDVVQVVREEMLVYKKEKQDQHAHPM